MTDLDCECGIRHPALPLKAAEIDAQAHEKAAKPFVPVWRRRATVKDLTGQLRTPEVNDAR